VQGQAIDKILMDYSQATDRVIRFQLEQKLAFALQQQQAYPRAIEFYKKALYSGIADSTQVENPLKLTTQIRRKLTSRSGAN
jgi:hypothetical protein